MAEEPNVEAAQPEKKKPREFVFNDPDSWPECCTEAKNQSPIDIQTSEVKRERFPPFRFKNYRKKFNALIANNGQNLTMVCCDCNEDQILVSGGCFEDEQYELYKIFFKWPAEHEINGQSYPLGVQLVHQSKKYPKMEDALKNNAVVVLEIFADTKNHRHSNIFGTIARQIPQVMKEIKKPAMLNRKIRLADFLPPDTDMYFTYTGSIPSPPCSEGVTWVVFQKPIHICGLQLKMFSCIRDKEGEPILENCRSLQKLNERVIISSEPC
ncbi:unnamed protein product [Brassicogethes aeneus]|uniref:carbonic anhydrase n=1 Tax=Brassicogethes aeneus TaxID=1431903 RepID=A0A9P0AX28_BRAAE|nr:unnamed protein product [Brassicogethes aeneus]